VLDQLTFPAPSCDLAPERISLLIEDVDGGSLVRRAVKVALAGLADLIAADGSESYDQQLAALTSLAERRRVTGTTAVIRSAARRLSIPFEVAGRRSFRVGIGTRQKTLATIMENADLFASGRLALDSLRTRTRAFWIICAPPQARRAISAKSCFANCFRSHTHRGFRSFW
jgi:hypothetical protein